MTSFPAKFLLLLKKLLTGSSGSNRLSAQSGASNQLWWDLVKLHGTEWVLHGKRLLDQRCATRWWWFERNFLNGSWMENKFTELGLIFDSVILRLASLLWRGSRKHWLSICFPWLPCSVSCKLWVICAASSLPSCSCITASEEDKPVALYSAPYFLPRLWQSKGKLHLHLPWSSGASAKTQSPFSSTDTWSG